MQPLVSIIIPAYNPGGLIRETILSVLAQTYANYEIIVVDDGSTDDTAEIVKRIDDPRLKYYFQPNSGLPAKPRNKGVELARGAYLAFLDHDDVWLPRKLEVQMAVVDKDPLIGLVCANGYFMPGGDKTRRLMVKGIKSGYLKDRTFLPGNVVFQSTALVRKECFKRVGGFNEDPELKAIEDYDLWLRLYAKYPCYFLEEPLAYYRVSLLSASGNAKQIFDRELNYYNKYYKSYGFSDRVKKTKLSQIMRGIASLQFASGNKAYRDSARIIATARPSLFNLLLYLYYLLPYWVAFGFYELFTKLRSRVKI
jgi:glycosyltransferase involved in cell wall biosynthesis